MISIEFISAIQDLLDEWQADVDRSNSGKKGVFPALTQIQSIMLKKFGDIPVEPESIRDGILHNCSSSDFVCIVAEPLLTKFAKRIFEQR